MNRSASLVVFLVALLFALVNGDADVDKFMEIYPHADRKGLEQLKAMNPIIDTKSNASVAVPLVMACPSIPAPADTDDVNNLRPGNIKVVMAMGDSITAAMSAKDTTFLSLKEYRGLSYAIGGDSGVTTMPNILKSYASTLIGASTGIGERSMKTNGLNAAVSGAINIDLLEQAKWLVQQVQADSRINLQKDWKLLTVWIGSNNLCDVCDDEGNNNADNYERYVTEALQYIQANIPRVFVNLAVNLDITQLDNIQEGLCDFLHGIACACVTSARTEVYAENVAYQQRAAVIAKKFTGSKTFAVVVQPFLQNTAVLKRSELSAGDCFHPSAFSHGVAATALWNNMITPASQKKTAWSLTDVPQCASANTLLYTN